MTHIARPPGNDEASLFMRLEGPRQSWGIRAIGRYRRTHRVPTKSGVIGLLGAALGLSRQELNRRLDVFSALTMGVRVDRAGRVEEDYHTVGARLGVLAADGTIKKTASTRAPEAIISRREYVTDASFLVVLSATGKLVPLVDELAVALQNPKWPLFLGRKRCVPGTRVFAGVAHGLALAEAIQQDGPEDPSLVWPDSTDSVRVVTDLIPAEQVGDLIGVRGTRLQDRYDHVKACVADRLCRLDPPVHAGRIVLDFEMARPVSTIGRPDFRCPWLGDDAPVHLQRSSGDDPRRAARAKAHNRCVFCRFEPADPRMLHAHHVTYLRRGHERVTDDWSSVDGDDLVMLCSECHAAVTMLEYQNGFGLTRIDPRERQWYRRIVAAREARRRHRDRSHLIVGASAKPRSGGDGQPLDLIQSIIPVRAGSSFPCDAPGNAWLANRHHVHQRLSMAFPNEGGQFAAGGYGVNRGEGGFLFRIECGRMARLVVQSRIVPDWGRAFGRVGWLVRNSIPAPAVLDPTTHVEGTQLRFRLEANPVKRLRADGPAGRKGARVPLRDHDALYRWMHCRAEDGGFVILDGTVAIKRLGRQTARMRSCPDRHWDSVHFSGELRVTDCAAFGRVLTDGIGPAKAFGFGLLSVAPVR